MKSNRGKKAKLNLIRAVELLIRKNGKVDIYGDKVLDIVTDSNVQVELRYCKCNLWVKQVSVNTSGTDTPCFSIEYTPFNITREFNSNTKLTTDAILQVLIDYIDEQ